MKPSILTHLESRIERLEKEAGKTIRRVPRDMFRRPSRNIMPRDMEKVRSKAVPPNAYDDIPFSGGQHEFYDALHEMVNRGKDSDEIVKKLTRRFKVKAPFILEQLRRFYGQEMRVANRVKNAYMAWDERSVQTLIEFEGLEPEDIQSSDITFLYGESAVEVRTRWDHYLLFQDKEGYFNFFDENLKDIVEDKISEIDLLKMLRADKWSKFEHFAEAGELEPKDFERNKILRGLKDYKHLTKLRSENEIDKEDYENGIQDLCDEINLDPLEVTRSKKIISELFRYMEIDKLYLAKELELDPPTRYEKLLPDHQLDRKELYAVKVN